jgi:hypothetical protein
MGLGKQIKAKRKIKAAEKSGKMKALTGNDISHLNTGQQIRMGRKLDKALMQDAKRDLKTVSSASKGLDEIDHLDTKKATSSAKEKIRQSYSQTAHDKIDRISDNIHHVQQEVGKSKQEKAFTKATVGEIKNKPAKRTELLDHRLNVQAEKGKHRNLKRKTDVNVNVDSNDRVDSHDKTIYDNNLGRLGKRMTRRRRRQDLSR